MKILLVEPNYRNKYPPLGLMKISTYHKLLGDEVVFVKGKNPNLKGVNWDRIYISSLFTFYYSVTLDTIKYYKSSTSRPSNIFFGGPMATIKASELRNTPIACDIQIISGLIDKQGVLGDNEYIIDELTPDYSIINSTQNPYINYKYPVSDSYFLHITHGCIRKCVFCAVPIIEPRFDDCTTFSHKILEIDKLFGQQRNLKIMDNNILASSRIDYIVDELVKLGYGKSNKSYKKGNRSYDRYIDFNQGLDARLLFSDKSLMEKISRLEIKPMRVAFDHANKEFVKIYSSVMRQAAELKVKSLSNYILFNLDDTPQDFYDRLKVNIDLNAEFREKGSETEIWSFPMKYSPIFGEYSLNRKYIGKNWNKKKLRGIQCILIPTHGVVGPKRGYFEHAFGSCYEEFERIIQYPEKLIVNRKEHKSNGNIDKWNSLYNKLKSEDLETFNDIISRNKSKNVFEFIQNLEEKTVLYEILKMYLIGTKYEKRFV